MLASVADSARYDVAQLGEAALAGDAARALHVLSGLRAEGVEPTLVLWAVNKALRDLWHARARRRGGRAARLRSARRRRSHRACAARASMPFGRLTLRAERADRMIKGRLRGRCLG